MIVGRVYGQLMGIKEPVLRPVGGEERRLVAENGIAYDFFRILRRPH